jgi:small redox-active disulfide protein 2
MIVKVLGSGCAKCKKLEEKVQEIINKNNIDALVQHITQIEDIMKYGILSTPGLVINEKVKSFGSIPKDELILTWLKEEE